MSVTVLTPATATALTTPVNVRSDLGLSETAWPDARLIRPIAQASATAATFCRRVFGRETVRERFDLCGLCFTEAGGILLDRGPAFRVASAALDGVAILPESLQVADGRELFLLQDGDPVRWRGRCLVVVYEAGWLLPGEGRGDPPTAAPDLPADVERAVILLVGGSVYAMGRDPMVKAEDVDGVGSQSFYVQGASATLPHPEAEAILSRYRRVFLG